MLNREQIIDQIKANIYYYSQHANSNPKSELAIASVETLEEILEQAEKYNRVFDIAKNI